LEHKLTPTGGGFTWVGSSLARNLGYGGNTLAYYCQELIAAAKGYVEQVPDTHKDSHDYYNIDPNDFLVPGSKKPELEPGVNVIQLFIRHRQRQQKGRIQPRPIFAIKARVVLLSLVGNFIKLYLV